MTEERVGVGLKMKPGLKLKLEMAATTRNVFNYVVLEEALENYFGKERAEPEWVNDQNRPHLKKLAKVLATADAKTAEALDVILEGLLNLKRAKAARTERM